MVVSLKSTLPAIGRVLGVSPVVLYERQKMLIDERLVVSQAGRGPGSGVHATPETVALLTIATFATLAIGPQKRMLIRRLADAKCAPQCGLTGKSRFVDALATLLVDSKVAQRLVAIEFDVSHANASIKYDAIPDRVIKSAKIGNSQSAIKQRGGSKMTQFRSPSDASDPFVNLSVAIDGDTFVKLQARVSGSFE